MKCKRVIACLIVGICIFLFAGNEAEAAKKSYTKQDLKIMSAIIYCEAGNQSYAGKLAVGCVIMNRKKSSSFPNSIRGVVYQRGQFSPTWTGKMHKALVAYKHGKFKRGRGAQCVKAAKAALEGQTYVVSRGKKVNMRRYHYFNGSLSRARVRINGHDFK